MSQHTHTVGSPHDRKYLDCLGQPLQVGDTVMWFVAQSSSMSWNIGLIDKIVDTDRPAYVGYEEGPDGRSYDRVESWDTAYTLRVKTLEKVHPLKHIWEPPPRIEWQGDKRVKLPQSLDELRTNTIRAVERVIKVDVETDLR